ncbi:unnamed protein product [Cylicocyclus nassatus]|uniref:alanine transaminase n=1 Tax=Cylicocyclus nassatus TaxID=53992 RepID=A0AA36DU55_CYLNA|nr:unnamed protein product [Cylicocyclus nassatus]
MPQTPRKVSENIMYHNLAPSSILKIEQNSPRVPPKRLHAATRTYSTKVLTEDTMNPNMVTLQYAVTGPIVVRAIEIEKELAKGVSKPFKNVIRVNLGDAQAMGQKPITFVRQVLSCVSNPSLMETGMFPKDVIEHSKAIINDCAGQSIGAYTEDFGVRVIRKHIADYITKRDGGIPSNPENVALSTGASGSIKHVFEMFATHAEKKVGVMIPIPQFPLYSATIEEFGLGKVEYYLAEEKNWGLDVDELERAYQENSEKYNVKVLCVINPGNPSGQVLSRQNMEEVIEFAYKHHLFLMVDEVYQDNIYADGVKWQSFKRVINEMGAPYNKMELASFHSSSKGYMGECGVRGGYVEFFNLDPKPYFHLEKMVSAKSGSSVLGQTAIDCMVCPPKPGDPSYDQWLKEKTAILDSLKERAKLVEETFGSLEGISCNKLQGAMYAFPRLLLPSRAVEKAKSLHLEPDFFYAKQLLESAGICVVPGSGFGQKEGTYHFRTTILPQIDVMKDMLARFTSFHKKFMEEYR